jgi:hypothetical protein
MKNLVFFGLILTVAISATFADVQCYRCGLGKACSDNPFDGINTDKVTCPVGCLKIDGLDSENNPKLARGCGNLATTVCEKNKEHFGLTGELCSCTTDLCNGETPTTTTTMTANPPVDQGASTKVECYYCGLRKPCDDPFDGSKTDKYNCSVGCLKIDGLDSENNPKQARGCGDLTTTVCEKNKKHFGLTGELCSCTTDLCNGEAGSNAIVIVLVVLLVLAMIVAGALVWYFKDILKNLLFGTSSSQEPKSTAQEPEVPLVPQSTSAKEPLSPGANLKKSNHQI